MAKTSSKTIFFIGTFPPPIHGMSMVNAFMNDRLVAKDIQPVLINLSPESLDRALASRMARIRKVIVGLNLLRSSRRNCDTIYMSISGGYGQLYETLFILLGRLARASLFLHHHSFAYLDRFSTLTWLLVRVAGSSATHIVLCDKMAKGLSKKYRISGQTRILSNAVLIKRIQRTKQGPRQALNTIGFLGNISEEKGINEFLDVVGALEKQGQNVRALIVGPCQDKLTERLLVERLKDLRSAEYLGAKYGDEKDQFYQRVDVLLFPTRYRNEAEPLTVHESMADGIAVIASDRGCLSTIVAPQAGLVIGGQDNFVQKATEQIVSWRSDLGKFSQVSAHAIKSFEELRKSNIDELDSLLFLIGRLSGR